MSDGDLLCVTDRDSRYIVDRFMLGNRSVTELRANARLIAAAPVLLDELIKLRDWLGDKCDHGVLDLSEEYRAWLSVLATLDLATGTPV